jgi:hypothetical protein
MTTYNDKISLMKANNDEQDLEEGKSIEYYKNKFKMGMCVLIANEYVADNPNRNFTVMVFRMILNNSYNSQSFPVVLFKEKYNGNNLNSHVMLVDGQGLITDPSFGCENMTINKYLKFILENDIIEYDSSKKNQIIFDFQILEEKCRKMNIGYYNNNYDLCSYLIDTNSKKVINLADIFSSKSIFAFNP